MPQLADNPQVLAALADGTLDWATSFIPDIDNTFVAKDPGAPPLLVPPSSLVAFPLNLETPDENNKKAFNDVNFRRAVSMLIDRQTIIDIAGYGYPVINEDPAMLGELYAPSAIPKSTTQFGQYGKFDLEAGKALLDEAGYVDKDGDGFRDNPDGTPIAIDIDGPQWLDRLDRRRADRHRGLQAAGLNAKMATPEESVWTSDLIDGKYSMSLNATRRRPPIPTSPISARSTRPTSARPHFGAALDRPRSGRDAERVHPDQGSGRAEGRSWTRSSSSWPRPCR